MGHDDEPRHEDIETGNAFIICMFASCNEHLAGAFCNIFDVRCRITTVSLHLTSPFQFMYWVVLGCITNKTKLFLGMH